MRSKPALSIFAVAALVLTVGASSADSVSPADPTSRAADAPQGFTATENQPPSWLRGEDTYFSTSILWPVRNGWQVASRTRYVAVYGGGPGVNSRGQGIGRIAIFRQNYVRIEQRMTWVDVRRSGPLKLTDAPIGNERGLNRIAKSAKLRFKGRNGVRGTFDLATEKVTLDESPPSRAP